MASRIASFGGTAIKPGVSRNGRLYSREVIARMVARAQERLVDPEGMPLTMLTHHAADDDSTRIVGRVTALTLDRSGAARYEAVLSDTPEAHTILNLIEPDEDGQRFLRGVSIRGSWLGPVRQEQHGGQVVQVADDLELDGLDFTKRPGVEGAEVDRVERITPAGEQTETAGRFLIHESAPDALVLVETSEEEQDVSTTTPVPAAQTAETGSTPPDRTAYADNGYRDGVKRYPLGTAQETVAAWYAFTQETVTREYSAQQLKRARGRIGKALESHGFTITEGVLSTEPRPVSETGVTEFYDDSGSFCVNLTNGPIEVRVASWYVDAHELPKIGRAAMDGAIQALLAIDPDLDGAVDTSGEGEQETAPDTSDAVAEATGSVQAPDAPAPGSPDNDQTATAPAAQDDQETEEPAVSEPTSTAGATAAAIQFTPDQFAQLLATLGNQAGAPAAPAVADAPAETAPPAAGATQETAAPVAPAVAETEEARVARLVAEGISAALPLALQQHVQQNGGPTRKGLVSQAPVAPVGENHETGEAGLPAGWPQKPLHEYTEDERSRFLRPQVEQSVMGARSAYLQP